MNAIDSFNFRVWNTPNNYCIDDPRMIFLAIYICRLAWHRRHMFQRIKNPNHKDVLSLSNR